MFSILRRLLLRLVVKFKLAPTLTVALRLGKYKNDVLNLNDPRLVNALRESRGLLLILFHHDQHRQCWFGLGNMRATEFTNVFQHMMRDIFRHSVAVLPITLPDIEPDATPPNTPTPDDAYIA